MTSYATNITPYAAPTRDRTGPVVALVAGSMGAFLAFLLIAAASALLWAGDYKTDDGYYTTASHTYSTPTRALTTETPRRDSGVPGWLNVSDHLGRVRIDPTSSAAGTPAFVGIARTTDVDRYLDQVAHDEVNDLDFDPFTIETTRRAGEGRPAMPAAQTFWAATSADGRTLDWKVREGEWTAVVMNADGSPGVSVDAKAGAKVPLIGDLTRGFAIAGAVLGAIVADARSWAAPAGSPALARPSERARPARGGASGGAVSAPRRRGRTCARKRQSPPAVNDARSSPM